MTSIVAAAITICTIVAPWLVWTPVVRGTTAVTIFGAVAIIGACHGWGRVMARIGCYDAVEAPLAVQWGLATMIAVGGVMFAMGAYDPRLLIIAGVIAHTVDTAFTFHIRRAEWGQRLHWKRVRYWAVPATLLSVLAVVHILAGAGSINDRPYDDDTNVVAQLARLADTGGLADAIGYPRIVQLGGRMAIDGLVTAFADPRAVPMIEGIALVLLLWLGCSRVAPRDAPSALWATLLVVTGSAFAILWPDRLPLWLPAGLLVAATLSLHDIRSDMRGVLPLVLLGAALAVLRLELVPVGVAFAVAAWWLGHRPVRQDMPRLALIAGAFLFVVGMYAVARMLASAEIDAVARSLIEPRRGSALSRFVISAAIGAAVTPLLLVPLPRTGNVQALRWFAFAAAAGIGGVTGKFTSERLYGVRSLWVLAIAAMVVLAVEVCRRREVDRLAVALLTVLCLLVWEGRSARGRINWSWRYWELMHDVEYARHASPEGGDYKQLLAGVPTGERVAVWVTRPELLDYARHQVIDLRTPRVVRLRDPNGYDKRLARLLRASRARWLLFEVDDAHAGYRSGSWLHAALCPHGTQAAPCSDALEVIVRSHKTVASQHGVVLIDLR